MLTNTDFCFLHALIDTHRIFFSSFRIYHATLPDTPSSPALSGILFNLKTLINCIFMLTRKHNPGDRATDGIQSLGILNKNINQILQTIGNLYFIYIYNIQTDFCANASSSQKKATPFSVSTLLKKTFVSS